jgi:hypothetical protein
LTEPRAAKAPAVRCAGCGGALERDQEWCLECGTARTVLHRPPDWRVVVVVVAVVLGVALVAALVVGLSS